MRIHWQEIADQLLLTTVEQVASGKLQNVWPQFGIRYVIRVVGYEGADSRWQYKFESWGVDDRRQILETGICNIHGWQAIYRVDRFLFVVYDGARTSGETCMPIVTEA